MPTSCPPCPGLAFTSAGLPPPGPPIYLLALKACGVAHGYWDATTLGVFTPPPPATAISQTLTLGAPRVRRRGSQLLRGGCSCPWFCQAPHALDCVGCLDLPFSSGHQASLQVPWLLPPHGPAGPGHDRQRGWVPGT